MNICLIYATDECEWLDSRFGRFARGNLVANILVMRRNEPGDQKAGKVP